MLTAASTEISPTSSTVVVFQGAPYQAISWALIGAGTLSQVDAITDDRGVAKAVFTPSAEDQTATVEVSYGV